MDTFSLSLSSPLADLRVQAGELKLWIEETLRRFPVLELEDGSERLSLMFLNQYRAILVRLA
jgi:hypothetical protein